MKKIKRNDPCPCGSGKKFKKCCHLQQSSDQSLSWTDNDGIHFVAPGSPPSSEQLEKMTKEYQKQIRNGCGSFATHQKSFKNNEIVYL